MRNIKITRPMRGRTDTQAQLDENNLPVEESRNSAPLNITRAAKPKPPTSEMTPREALQGMPEIMGGPVSTQGFDLDLKNTDLPIYADSNIEAQLERDQSAFGLFANTIARGASTVVLGGAEALSYFADAENIGMALQEGEKDYSNWFADLMEKAQEEVREVTPIYRSERGQQDFAWDSATWWANNIESIATTASMFIPTAGIMRGLAFAGKTARGLLNTTKIANVAQDASKITKGLNKLMYGEKAESLLRTGASATVSRYMENTMEANETFNSVYQELIAEGVSDQEARLKAGEAAANTWKANWINLATDLVQYGSLTKGLNYAAPAAKGLRKQLAKGGYDYLKNAAGESLEEFGQYVISQESARAAKNDRSFFELEGLDRRLSDYVKDPEAQAAALLGAVGGTFFKAAGSTGQLYNRLAGVYEAQDADLAKRTFLDQLDVTNSYLVDGGILMNQAVQYGNAGKFSSLRSFYQDLADKTDEQLEAEGLTPEQIEDKRKKDAEILSDLDFLEREYTRLTEDASKDNVIKIQELGSLYEKHKLAQANDVIAAEKTKIEQEISNQIDTDKLSVKTKQYKLNSYKRYRDQYKKQVGKKQGSEDVVSYLDNKIEQLEKEIAEEKQQIKERTSDDTIPVTSRDADLFVMNDQEVVVDVRQQEAQRVIQNANTAEGKEELKNEHDEREIQATLDKVSPTSNIKFLKALVNPNNETPKGWDRISAKLKGIADKGEQDLAPPIAGTETFEQDLAARYANTPLLMREMLQLQKKVSSESDILALKKVENAEQFSNLYANNKTIAAAFDTLMSEKKSKYVKADIKGQTSADTTFTEPENSTDNTPTEEPEGPVIFTPEGEMSKPGETIAVSNAVVLYKYDPNNKTVRFSGLKDHRDPMSVEDAKELMDSLGYDSRFIKGAYRVLLTNDGQVVPSEFNTIKINGKDVQLLSDEEIKIINDPDSKLLAGKIKFSVPKDADLNKDPNTTADNLLIVLSTEMEVNGEMKEVKLGVLRNTPLGVTNTDALKRLRDTIFSEFKQDGLTPATEAQPGIFTSSIDNVIIGDRTRGLFNSGWSKPAVPVHEALGDDFAIGVVTVNANGDATFITKNIERKIEDVDKISNGNTSAFKNYKGNIIAYVKTPKGLYVPVRLQTTKLEDLPAEQAAVHDIIDEFFDAYDKGELVTKKKARNVKGIDIAEENKAVYAKIKELNKKLLQYVPMRLAINTTIGGKLVLSVNKDAKGNNVLDSTPISREDAKKYADGKTMRIDEKKINTGNYNKTLSEKGWLTVNLDMQNPMIASDVVLKIGSLPVPPQIKGVTTVSQAQPTTKATIEGTSIITTPVADIVTELNKLSTFQEKLNWLKDKGLLSPININGKQYDTIDYNGRVMVLMKIGQYNIPFYISTGQAGKKNVKSGNWYAVFGIGEKGWINKGTEEEINKQYDRTVLQKIAQILNEGVGTIESREDGGNGKLKDGIGFLEEESNSITSFNNQMNLPTQPAASNTKVKEFYDHVASTLQALDTEVASLSSQPTTEETTTKKTPSTKTVTITDSNWLTIAQEKEPDTFTLDVNMKDGSVINTKTGQPLDPKKDSVLINKAHLKSKYLTYEKLEYKGSVYAITSDNRIIDITPDGGTIGGEIEWDSKQGQNIRNSKEEIVPDQPETTQVPSEGGALDFTGQDSSIVNEQDEDTKDEDKHREASDPEGSYKVWDKEKELAWFKKNYPDVPIEVLDDLREIAGKGPARYWGVFKNASVFIAEQAKEGTAYHEAFHVVFNLMLTDAERQQILDEGSRFAKGAIAIEEYWADAFIDYQLSDGNTAHTLPEKVADFFKRLWHIIKIITERTGLTKPASMEDYMYRVSRGLYGNGLVKRFGGVNFKRNVTRFSKQTENKSDYLNVREEQIGKRVMNAILINDVLPAYKNLYKMPDATDSEIIKKVISEGLKRKDPSLSIAGLYKNVYQFIETRRNKTTSKANEKLLSRLLDSIATKDEASGDLAMKPLFARAARSLSYYGIKMSITLDTLSKTKDNLGEDMLLEETEDVIENWMVKEKFISNKEKFSQKAKALFAKVPLRGESFGGYTVYEQPSHVFNKLTSKLSSSRSVPDMMSKLDELVKFNPSYKVIQKALEDPALMDDFWKNMGQRSFTPFISMTSEKGVSRTFIGNSEDASKQIAERWAAEFRDSSLYNATDSKVIPPKGFSEKVQELEDLKNESVKDVQDNPLEADGNISREKALKLSNILKVIKMPIPHKEVVEMFSDREPGVENSVGGKKRFNAFTSALLNHMKTIERGADPFSGAIESNKYLDDIINAYLEVFPNLFQKTFKSGTNELIYSMLQARFMQKFERELKNVKNNKEREEFIKNYMQDPFYQNSPFLQTLLDESVVAERMHIAVFDALKTEESNTGIEYSKLTPQQLEAVRMNAFFNQQFDSVKESTEYGYFMMPVLSDSTSAAFMYFKKLDIAEAKAALVKSAMQERDRIEWLSSRIDPVRKEYNAWREDQFNRNIKHKDKAPLPEELKDIPYNMLKNGGKFQIFTDLNTTDADISTEKGFEEAVIKMIDAAAVAEREKMLSEGILELDENGEYQDATGVIDGRFLDPEVARQNLSSYVYNNMLMNIQTLVTFGGDVAFYKSKNGDVDFTDVYKRIKEIWSPGDYLNADTSNQFVYTSDEKSETITVGETYKTLYVTDPAVVDDVVSEHLERIKEIHKDNPNKESIIENFSDLNETDAATIIDPIRAREIELGVRGLTNEKYEFYDSLMESGRPIEHVGADHINVVYKPFQFFHNRVVDSLGNTRINPTQHKNAEFLVTPAMAVGNPKLEEAMEKFGYTFNKDGSWSYNPKNRITDSIMFTTAVKVGEVGSVDSIADATSEDVQEFYNSDYRIQMETPEHHIDTDVIEGVQYRKLVIENVDSELEYTMPDGTVISGAKLVSDYNKAIYENVYEGYEELKKLFYDEETGFPDNDKIINALREQVIEQEKPEDMLRALDWLDVNRGMEIGPDGDLIQGDRETVLPLWHPDIVYQVESMMNSFFKKRVSKQKTEKGGGASLYNASSYGLSAENPKGYRKPKIVFNEEGGIDHFEAILPVTMSSLEEYADKNGFIDIKKIEEIDPDILKGIFYRIPTEHKYSMFHIKVIGFLPAGVGGQIILPEEATTIAGLDFDIDKLYGLLYNIEEYGEALPEMEAKYQKWKSTPNYSPKAGKDIVRADIDNFDDTRGRIEFAAKENIRWDKKNNEFATKKTLRKVPSGMDSKASRDNLKLDLAFAVLTNKRTAQETLTPGGFEIIENTVDYILELSGQTKGKLNPMLNSTGREVFNRNMTGLDLIGIFANHVANHSLMTLGNVYFPVIKKNGKVVGDNAITFNGQTLRSLSQMKVGDVNIMDLKQFLAAAVDNGKNPLASFLNLTTVTADVVATMVRVGFSIESVLMFSANPALKKMTKDLSRAGNTFQDTQKEVLKKQRGDIYNAIQKIISPKDPLKADDAVIISILQSTELTYDPKTKKGTLVDSIKKSNKTIEDLIEDGDVEELAVRYNALALYEQTSEVNAQPLSQIMSHMRYDSSNNAAGPTIAHNKAKELKKRDLYKIESIVGWEQLMSNSETNPVRHVAAFYKYGVEEASRITSEVTKIPYGTSDNNIFNVGLNTFMEMVVPQDKSMTPENINQFYRAIETMLATSYPTFKLEEMRRVVETLPSRIKAYENANPDSPYTTFLRHFNPQSSKVVKFKILRFDRNGVDAIQKEEMKKIFLEMLNDSNEEVSALAHDLVKYAFATTGYIETPYKFTDLVPVDYTSALQENGQMRYVDHLKKHYDQKYDSFEGSKDLETMRNIIDQIVRNRYRHLSLKYIDIENNKNVQHLINNNVLEILIPAKMVASKGEKTLLTYVKSAYEKDGKMTSVPLKATGEITEDGMVVYREISRLGADNEILEMSYDNAVNNKPLVSEIESYDYIPTEAEKKAKFSKVELNPVSATEALLAASELLPDLSFEKIEKLTDKNRATHPFMIAINKLSLPQRRQLRNIVGENTTMSHKLVTKLVALSQQAETLPETKPTETTQPQAKTKPVLTSTTFKDVFTEEEQQRIVSNVALKHFKGDETKALNYINEAFAKTNNITVKVISGGQTGVDQLGLTVATSLGIETGGTAPKGYRTEKGNDESLADFGLVESSSAGYPARTEDNVRNSDGTVYFALDVSSAGLRATKAFAKKHNKPFILNPDADTLRNWIKSNNVVTLNVAGNRASKIPVKRLKNIESLLTSALRSDESIINLLKECY